MHVRIHDKYNANIHQNMYLSLMKTDWFVGRGTKNIKTIILKLLKLLISYLASRSFLRSSALFAASSSAVGGRSAQLSAVEPGRSV